MKYYVASTYKKGIMIIRANNKSDAIIFLEDRNIDYYDIEIMNKYFNREFEDRQLSITIESIEE